jgi:hypothetical protein
LIAAFPFCAADVHAAKKLLKWIEQLGGCKNHTALLVSDCGVGWSEVIELRQIAEKNFKKVWVTATERSVNGWPQGPNSLFRTAAECVEKDFKEHWFWCEADCIPLKPGWLNSLDHQHRQFQKPFLGAWVNCNQPGLPEVSVAGCAVYPDDAASRLRTVMDANPNRAWDVACAPLIVPQSSTTALIEHFWGQPDLAPTFAERKRKDSPINTFTLDNINPLAVVFHRNKDGTLLRLLQRKLFHEEQPKITVAVAFCNKDSRIALKHCQWLSEICPKSGYSAVLSVDADTIGNAVQQAIRSVSGCFPGVRTFQYRCGSTCSWPHGANVAFRNTAQYMQKNAPGPWLWLEPDAVATRGSWLDELQAEYEIAGKLFMGPIVPGMGHCNGMAIYPKDTPDFIPNALHTESHLAWDSVMKEEMIWECHNAEPLIQHVWGIVNGQAHPILGEAPVFRTQNEVKAWLNPKAALFHRCKDASLIDRLRELRK